MESEKYPILLDRMRGSPATLCEIGCGAGAVLEALERKLPDTNFVGYDIAPAAIELARERETPRLDSSSATFCGGPGFPIRHCSRDRCN